VLKFIQYEQMDIRTTRRSKFSDKFKAAVAILGDKAVNEVTAKRQHHVLLACLCLQLPRGDIAAGMETATVQRDSTCLHMQDWPARAGEVLLQKLKR
jgi:hypothetical protein